MNDIDTQFFREKRHWSEIKDRILGGYMPAYLSKVAKLGRPILLIDGHAGAGIYEDDSIGSPIIMCSAAEKHVKGKYSAIFVNRKRNHHNILRAEIERRGWNPQAQAVLGDSSSYLTQLSQQLRDQTVFIYLDPFGLKGCEFATIKPFLTRDKRYSTEIVINMNMPITHRLASTKAVAEGRGNAPRIINYHTRLTQVFGGDYWKDIYFSNKKAEEKEIALMQEYRRLIGKYLPYTGSCPVRKDQNSRVKYFITFASRHPHAMFLMNEEMCKAYFGQMHQTEWAGTLFEGTNPFRKPQQKLDLIVEKSISLHPGNTRKNLWLIIIQEHFMQFTESEYRQSIQRLIKTNRISAIYTHTGRLNDDCKLNPIA